MLRTALLASALSAASSARVAPEVAAARAEAAVLASFVVDAAAMSFHWVYSQQTIKDAVGSGDPEFFVPPENYFYHGVVGQNTPYGQQNIAYLKVGAASGGFDPAAVETAYFSIYDPSTCPGPNGGVYLDESTKEFVRNVQAGRHYPDSGGNDDQADAAAHMVAVVAVLAGNTSAVLSALEPVIRVTQDTDNAVAFGSAAARVLEKLIVSNLTAVEALTETVADLRDAARIAPHAQDAALADQMEAALAAAASGEDASAFILRNGQTCDYAFTLSNVAFLAAAVDDSAAGLLKGARANIVAGGDSGSRGIFFGALAGARLGDKALIPRDWVAKTTVYAEVAPLAAALVAHRSA